MTNNSGFRYRRPIASAVLALALGITAPVFAQDNGTKFGAFDPEGTFAGLTTLQTEHIYVPLFDVDLVSIEDAAVYAKARNRELLITVEAFSWTPNWSINPNTLREEMMAGTYDADIEAVCGAIGKIDIPVTIRFAQEMDFPIQRFPWSGWLPEDYIAFYRHFHDVCAPLVPDAQFAWSPRGEENLLAYYPGDEYADRVGISLFSLQQYELDLFGRPRSYFERVQARYAALATLGKPIGIFEVGFEGDEAFDAEMANQLKRLPQQFVLSDLVYFNAVDPAPWPNDYGYPDWRVKPEVFATLTPEE